MSNGDQVHRWNAGVCVGFCNMTGQYKIACAGVLRMACTVKRLPNAHKWSSGKVLSATVTPWKTHTPNSPVVIFQKCEDAELAARRAEEELVRKTKRAPITRADLADHGITPGCPKCDHALRYGYGLIPFPRPEECGAILYTCFVNSPKGQARIARMGQRQFERMIGYQEQLERVQRLREEPDKDVEFQQPQRECMDGGDPA